MNALFQGLRPFIRRVVRYAGWVLAVAVLFSVVGLYFALKLRIDTDFANLIPQDYPSVQALERLRETVGGESEVTVAIQSPSFEANKAFAEALIPKALSLQGEEYEEPYLNRVEYRRDVAFLKRNALYFATPAELDSVETYLRNQIEEATLAANPFFFDLEEEEDEAAADTTAQQFEAVYDRIVGKAYPISDDSTVMAVRFYPSGSQTNIGFIRDLYDDLDELVETMEPASFHEEMEITLAGRLQRQLVEIRAITRDVLGSFGVGVAAVLLVVTFYFGFKSYQTRAGRQFSWRLLLTEVARFPVMALLIGIPLFMSLTWTFGVAYLVFGTLNLMTSALGLVLFGLGIDFGIHFFARYTEERAEGRTIAGAAEQAFTSTGQAITVGALTTAAALYVLVLAHFRGFSEFGFIAGNGILFALIAMIVVLPALIAVCERLRLLDLDTMVVPTPKCQGEGRRFRGSRGLVLGSLLATIVALILLPRVDFEYQFGRLEPEYTAYEQRRAVVRQVFEPSERRNPAYVVADSPQEVPAIVTAVREQMAQDTTSPTILDVESLQDRFPLQEAAQERKLARVAEIRDLLSRDALENETSEDLERLRQAAQTRAPIAIEQVPDYLKKQFTTKSGEVGGFVMIYPNATLADARNSMAFSDDIGTIVTADGEVYHAGSTSLVAADMIRLMLAEAPWMVAGTFLIVVLLMWVNFGSLKWAGLALLPLVVGVLWMLLLMEILGLKLNFYNLVVLPAVLGIGNDAGAHMVHRYREEGFGSICRVLRSTGEHVSMGALTTMIGFAGLLLSFHPGLRSIGELAVVGIGTTLFSALLFLPALIQWIEDCYRRREQRASENASSTSPTTPKLAVDA